MARVEDPNELETGGTDAHPLRRLIPELKPFWALMLLCAVITMFQSAFGFLPPYVLGDIVNRLQRGDRINTMLYLGVIVGLAAARTSW